MGERKSRAHLRAISALLGMALVLEPFVKFSDAELTILSAMLALRVPALIIFAIRSSLS